MGRFKAVVVGSFAVLLAGCYTQGNSYLVADGEKELFLSMARCETQATSRFPDGSPKYAGYVCKKKLAGFMLEERDYSNGKLEYAVK